MDIDGYLVVSWINKAINSFIYCKVFYLKIIFVKNGLRLTYDFKCQCYISQIYWRTILLIQEEYHSCHTKVSRKDVRFFAIFFDLFPLFLDKKGTALWYKKLMKINVFALFSFANSISSFKRIRLDLTNHYYLT